MKTSELGEGLYSGGIWLGYSLGGARVETSAEKEGRSFHQTLRTQFCSDEIPEEFAVVDRPD